MFTVNSFFQKKLKNLAFSLESCVYVDSGGVFSTRDTQLSIIIYRSRGHNRFMGFSLPDAFLRRYGRPWRGVKLLASDSVDRPERTSGCLLLV